VREGVINPPNISIRGRIVNPPPEVQ